MGETVVPEWDVRHPELAEGASAADLQRASSTGKGLDAGQY